MFMQARTLFHPFISEMNYSLSGQNHYLESVGVMTCLNISPPKISEMDSSVFYLD